MRSNSPSPPPQPQIVSRLDLNLLRPHPPKPGLDNYLLQTPDHKLASESGLDVKKRILAAMARLQEAGVVPGPRGGAAAPVLGGSVAAMGAADMAAAGAAGAGGGGGGVVG